MYVISSLIISSLCDETKSVFLTAFPLKACHSAYHLVGMEYSNTIKLEDFKVL